VAGHQKFTAGKTVDVRQASREIEYAAAALTMKVMMMRLPGALVDGRGTGKIDGHQPTLLEQSLDIPVDRCDTQALDLGLRSL